MHYACVYGIHDTRMHTHAYPHTPTHTYTCNHTNTYITYIQYNTYIYIYSRVAYIYVRSRAKYLKFRTTTSKCNTLRKPLMQQKYYSIHEM